MRGSLDKKRFPAPARLALALVIALAPLAAQAYVGPGAGLSLLGALWGVLCAIGAAFLFVILWPIRRLRRRRREAKRGEAGQRNEPETRQPAQVRAANDKTRAADGQAKARSTTTDKPNQES